MRIIAGKYKKSNLFSVPGNTSRPTTDYIKELIFSVIQDCKDAQVLDLFAGSGGLSFEALSRGAKFTTMVDFSDKAIMTMKRNIEKLKCSDNCRIYKKRTNSFISKSEIKYDIILMDPPYDKNLVNKTVELILNYEILNPKGIIIIEHSSHENLNEEFISKRTYYKKNGETTISMLMNS